MRISLHDRLSELRKHFPNISFPVEGDIEYLISFLAKEVCKDENRYLAYVCALVLRPVVPILVDILFNRISEYSANQYQNACIACAEIILVCPHMSQVILHGLCKNSSIYSVFYEWSKMGEDKILRILNMTLFLLREDYNHSLSAAWKWNELFDICKNSKSLGFSSRVCSFSAKCISMILRMNEDASKELLKTVSNHELDISKDCMIVNDSVRKRLANAYAYTKVFEDDSEGTSLVDIKHSGLVDVSGIILPSRNTSLIKTDNDDEIVLVDTTCSNMRSLAASICTGMPVLIEGSIGSGKSSLIRSCAKLTGNDKDIIFIHLDDQIDSKILIGTETCTEIPGFFKWQPGALTQAVTKGCWVVLEDIDQAPFEVLAALTSLFEKRELLVQGKGKVISANHGFQLFATLRNSHSFAKNSNSSIESFIDNYFVRVFLEPFKLQELSDIIESRYPTLRSILHIIVNSFDYLTSELNRASRSVSSRDLFKFCKRISMQIPESLDTKSLVERVRQNCYMDLVDCFVSHLRNINIRNKLAKELGKIWNLDETSFIEPYLFSRFAEIDLGNSHIQVGRIKLTKETKRIEMSFDSLRNLSVTRSLSCLMEKIAACVANREPLLLCGETGNGKTAIVQDLAMKLGKKLVVQNLNQQTDSSEFLGGYRPVDLKLAAMPIMNFFAQLFPKTFKKSANAELISALKKMFELKDWPSLINMLYKTTEKALGSLGEQAQVQSQKRTSVSALTKEWETLKEHLNIFRNQVSAVQKSVAFWFSEGTLIKAIREGYWILLDEINLASSEALQRISEVLESESGSITLLEKGDSQAVKRHPEFRIFACMNPGTDFGKKELSAGIRSRFTEVWVDDLLDPLDLSVIVHDFLKLCTAHPPVKNIVEFYLEARQLANSTLIDGSNQKPHYSIRSLVRSLSYCKENTDIYGFRKALYEGFYVSFLSPLAEKSQEEMKALMCKYLLDGNQTLLKSIAVTQNAKYNRDLFVSVEGFLIPRGKFAFIDSSDFILTKTIKNRLQDVARVIAGSKGKYPILLQGPTSAGKTSLVKYIAENTGHKLVRINNHEHTDLQEYIGSYVSGTDGKLKFQEGALVEALRNGYWIVLDELNLCPSDVLEALNRLLDDNRELLIQETQEVITPHPSFMLFATQNPPGTYGGRKILSKAFKNRFIELHMDDIPSDELVTILEKRCQLPPSYCKRMVSVMNELHSRRQESRIFAGKQSFLTPRDLFKWANRRPQSLQDLANSGFMLLGERLRSDSERAAVKDVIELTCKSSIDQNALFESSICNSLEGITWTHGMKRLFALTEQCVLNNESALLVGTTGAGKTTVVQMLAKKYGRKLHIINCHQSTETADLIGSLRPIRNRSQIIEELRNAMQKYSHEANVSFDYSDLDSLVSNIKATFESRGEAIPLHFKEACARASKLFEWIDGPVVEAMKNGDMILIDEISLAEDSVLERLNSVLENPRSLFLAEKGGESLEVINAHPNFIVIATMNPGGDYGKKELSPALRNRFTEIWVYPFSGKQDFLAICNGSFSFKTELKNILSEMIVQFIEKYNGYSGISRSVVSFRDIKTWIRTIETFLSLGLSSAESYLQGVCMVFLDGFGIGVSESASDYTEKMKRELREFVEHQISSNPDLGLLSERAVTFVSTNTLFGIEPFLIPRSTSSLHEIASSSKYSLESLTVSKNLFCVLRAMQLEKAILLEGSPGVGKSSLINALAKLAGHTLIRINLSEQTDMMDLLGSDLPVKNGLPGQFQWCDGVFLSALKNGDWVLFDEMNLASQSVLEGLNAVLDHRAQVYIPELNQTFDCHPNFRFFASQNPVGQGGGRKSLPQSFLNRFTKVYLQELTSEDLLFIAMEAYPKISKDVLEKIISLNATAHDSINISHKVSISGGPWEFNLRDIFRWCDLIEHGLTDSIRELRETNSEFPFVTDSGLFFDFLYIQRLRNQADREWFLSLYEQIFGSLPQFVDKPICAIASDISSVGFCLVPKNHKLNYYVNEKHGTEDSFVFESMLKPLESVTKSVQMKWPVLLVGKSGSGKTRLIRLIAEIMNQHIEEYALTSSTDASELLGGFEQIDFQRCLGEFLSYLISFAFQCIQILALQNRLADSKKLWDSISSAKLLESHDFHNSGRTDRVTTLPIIEKLIEEITNLEIKDMDSKALKEKFDVLLSKSDMDVGRFEWRDGPFINAVEKGYWIVLDNANFCNPSILDRINSLLENNGFILLNECGVVEGNPRIIYPHPNFRVFFTMNPDQGEVSRALRNRCAEIYLSESFSDNDCIRVLNGKGVPGNDIASSLISIHKQIAGNSNFRKLFYWVSLANEQINRGENPYNAFTSTINQIYGSIPENFSFDSQFRNQNFIAASLWPYFKQSSSVKESSLIVFEEELLLNGLQFSQNSFIEDLSNDPVLLVKTLVDNCSPKSFSRLWNSLAHAVILNADDANDRDFDFVHRLKHLNMDFYDKVKRKIETIKGLVRQRSFDVQISRLLAELGFNSSELCCDARFALYSYLTSTFDSNAIIFEKNESILESQLLSYQNVMFTVRKSLDEEFNFESGAIISSDKLYHSDVSFKEKSGSALIRIFFSKLDSLWSNLIFHASSYSDLKNCVFLLDKLRIAKMLLFEFCASTKLNDLRLQQNIQKARILFQIVLDAIKSSIDIINDKNMLLSITRDIADVSVGLKDAFGFGTLSNEDYSLLKSSGCKIEFPTFPDQDWFNLWTMLSTILKDVQNASSENADSTISKFVIESEFNRILSEVIASFWTIDRNGNSNALVAIKDTIVRLQGHWDAFLTRQSELESKSKWVVAIPELHPGEEFDILGRYYIEGISEQYTVRIRPLSHEDIEKDASFNEAHLQLIHWEMAYISMFLNRNSDIREKRLLSELMKYGLKNASMYPQNLAAIQAILWKNDTCDNIGPNFLFFMIWNSIFESSGLHGLANLFQTSITASKQEFILWLDNASIREAPRLEVCMKRRLNNTRSYLQIQDLVESLFDLNSNDLELSDELILFLVKDSVDNEQFSQLKMILKSPLLKESEEIQKELLHVLSQGTDMILSSLVRDIGNELFLNLMKSCTPEEAKWIFVGIVGFLRNIPDQNFDPIVHISCQIKHLEMLKEDLLQELALRKQTLSLNGVDCDFYTDDLQNRLNLIEKELEVLKSRNSFRPLSNLASFSDLVDELKIFSYNVINIRKLTDVLASNDSIQVQIIFEAMQILLQKFKCQYESFLEITYPLKTFLGFVCIGLEQIKNRIKLNVILQSNEVKMSSLLMNLPYSAQIHTDLENISNMIDHIMNPYERLLVFKAVFGFIESLGNILCSDIFLVFQKLLKMLVEDWHLNFSLSKEEENSSSKTFSSSFADPSDINAKLISRLFDGGIEEDSVNVESQSKRLVFSDSDSVFFMKTIGLIFSNLTTADTFETKSSSKSRLNALELIFLAARVLVKDTENLKYLDIIDERFFHLSESILMDSKSKINHEDCDTENFLNWEELKLTESCMISFLNRIQTLLKQFENHPILCQLVGIIEKVLLYNVNGLRLSQLAASLHVLCTKAQQWEIAAAKSVSLKLELSSVAVLLAKLRKRQLECWSKVLKNRRADFGDRNASSWFRICRFVLDESLKETDICSMAEDYIRSSSVGDFHHRLLILKNFGGFISKCSSKVLVGRANILLNVVLFFQQFLKHIETFDAQNTNELSKRMQERVKIEKWDISNWNALESSSLKLQKDLIKQLTDLDTVLEKPFVQIIANFQSCSDDLNMLKSHFRQKPLLLDDLNESALKLNTSHRAIKLIRSKSDFMSTSFQKVSDLGYDLIERIQDIRELPVMVKKKTLVDMIKSFNEYGLSYHSDFEIPLRIQVMKIQPLSQIINDHAYNDWKSSAVVSDELFFKGNFMLESIMMYREDAISKDLSRIEIQRCKTMLSHLYSIIGDQRAIFSQILGSYFDLLHPLKKNWHSDDLFSKRNIASDCIEVLRVLNIKDQSEITLKNLFKTPAESIDLDNLSIFKQFFKKLNFALNEVQVQDIQELPDVLIDKLELLVKVVVQNILKAFESISNLSEKWIFDLHQMIIQLPSMLKISGIISLAQKNNLKCNENEELLSTYGYCSKQIISSLFTFHVELCKLNVVLHAVIKNLFKEGFCRPKDESEADAENDDQTFDGTGMGEGEGEKDVSKEIEDEEQMQGLQGEEKHQSESGPQYQEDAFDMENDFDGDLMDMKLDNEDNSEDDNEKEDGTDMDKEMGDTGENSEQIDEKLWNDEDEEDEDADNPEDGKEKKEGYNENASKAEENELDLVAKPNFEDSNEKEKKEEDSNIPDDPTDDNEELNEQLKDLADQNDENEAFPEKREKDDLHESGAPEDIQEREPEDNGDSDVEVDEENQMSNEDNNSEEDVEDPATTDNAEDAENRENNNFDNDEPEPDIPESSNVDGNPAGHDEEAKENDEDTPEKDDDMGVDSSMNQVDGSADIQNQTNNSELGLENAAESELKDQSMSDIQKDMQNDQKSKDSVTAAQSESPEASENILPGSNSVQDSNEQSSSDTSQSSSESAQSFGDAMKTWFSRLEVLDNQQKNQERKSDIIEDDDQEFDGHRPELAEHVGENERADAQVMLPKNSDENEPIAYPKIDEIKEESAEDILENADPDPEKDALEEIRKADSSSNSSEPKTENTANSHDKKNSQLEKDKSKIKHESDSKPDQGPSVSLPSSMPSHSILKETPAVIDTEEMDETIKSHLEFLNSLEEDSRKDFKSFVDEYIGSDEFEKGMQLWKSLEVETADSSHQLCEQLRIILEPTQMSKMQGDFKTGKRLNMRKIIPYIASEFRKDKIWMRRTKPNKRNYQVVVAIDNSRSMLEVGAGRIALSALALLWSALNKLEAGQVSVISFGDEIRLLHDLNSNFDTSKGAYIASQFEFQDNHTQWTQLATTLVSLFEKSKQHSSDSSKFLQLAFVISDARIQEDKSLIQQWVREASVRKQFLVVIIVDNPDPRQTILNLKSVSYDANRSLKITKYLDEFPFPYYVIVRDISSMPFILSDALRQWFEMIRSCE